MILLSKSAYWSSDDEVMTEEKSWVCYGLCFSYSRHVLLNNHEKCVNWGFTDNNTQHNIMLCLVRHNSLIFYKNHRFHLFFEDKNNLITELY